MHVSEVRLDNYAGLWCVEPARFSQIIDRVNKTNIVQHVQSQQPGTFEVAERRFSMVEGERIAVVDVQGVMTKAGSSLGGGGTIAARRAIRQADQDPSVDSILIRFDTPGGNVAGTQDLADEIAKAGKPTIAFIEDLCCSAGMWAASQCREVYANNTTAMVGSIGTFMALYDISKALENEGVKAIVIKAGEFKGGGFPGTEISDAQIAEWQKQIDAIQEQFTNAIATGRKLSLNEAQKLVTGLTYVASDALSMKLIDGIKTFDEVVAGLRSKTPSKGMRAMTTEKIEPKAATYKEIVAACPGIDPTNSDDALFITECLKDEMTAADANELYCETLQSRLKAAEEKIDAQAKELTELKASAKPKGSGAPTVGTSKGDSEKKAFADAQSEWRAAVAAKVASGMSRDKAVMTVNKEQPQLREAMLAGAR